MSDENRDSTVLLIGDSDTGKTHYGAQLLGRLQVDAGGLKLATVPESIEPLRGALLELNKGLPAGHTSREMYDEVRLPLIDTSGRPITILWPDYGGEKIGEMVTQRRVGPEWRSRINRSQLWILFIRPALLLPEEDVFSRPIHEVIAGDGGSPKPRPWSKQAWYTELLQLFVFVRSAGILSPLRVPRLAVVLSCWDELPPPEVDHEPAEVLFGRAPLLSQFLNAQWEEEAVEFFGLSSLGRPLDRDQPDDEFREVGPESFGYAVAPDGSRDSGLTLPLSWLLATSP